MNLQHLVMEVGRKENGEAIKAGSGTVRAMSWFEAIQATRIRAARKYLGDHDLHRATGEALASNSEYRETVLTRNQRSQARSGMCCRKLPRHPECRHAAQGTVTEGAKLDRCEESAQKRNTCLTVRWGFYDVGRGFCDRCIINGELLAQRQGLDPGIYCERMGVSYSTLREANPGALP